MRADTTCLRPRCLCVFLRYDEYARTIKRARSGRGVFRQSGVESRWQRRDFRGVRRGVLRWLKLISSGLVNPPRRSIRSLNGRC